MNEIERRRLLRAGAVAIGVGFAGCLGGGGDDGGDDGEEDGSENDGNGDENEAQASFDAAIETLGIVEAELSTYRAAERDPTAVAESGIQSEDVENLRSRLSDAESTLGEIDASGELATQVSIAQDVVAFQRTLVDALDIWRERDAAYSEAFIAQGNENYESAASAYGTATDALSEYQTLLSEIESAHAAIDSDAFEADAISYGDEVWTYLRINSGAELDARQAFLAGEQSRVTGLEAFFSAEQSYNAEQWDAAQQGYQDASVAFEDASTTYENVLNNADTPAVIEATVDGRAEESAGLVDAMALLVDAAEEAAAGNLEEASELRQQARDEFL